MDGFLAGISRKIRVVLQGLTGTAPAAAVELAPSMDASSTVTMKQELADSAQSDMALTAAVELSLAALGAQVPAQPGDVLLCGRMADVAAEQLSQRCKCWVNMLADHEVTSSDDASFKAISERAGEGLVVKRMSWAGPKDEEGGLKIVEALDSLPRPLVLQCASGNRAGAILLLWLARQRGYSAASAQQLAEDLDLKFFTRCATCGPVRNWVLGHLPSGTEPMKQQKTGGAVVHQLFDPVTSTFTYLIGCRTSGKALLLDPVLEQKARDLSMVDELGFKLQYVLNTHVHADHVTSGGQIRKLRPEVETIIAESSGAKADKLVKHGDTIEVGKIKLEVRATPGHTTGCLTYILRDTQPGGVSTMAFTGDALLIRGCGRTDFQAGSAEQLYDSVHSQIFSLPDDTLIYPSHDYKGRNVSTVGEEKQYNSRLTKSKEEFVKIMGELGLPYPKQIDIAVPSNMVCGVQD
ncbi:unnamed protein product [Polarella glacialis]|uniref:persulfide dioxygenase n=1 Tax=Polarella glacialis TaxID=89957 RepID=A0A813GBX3_POLGL|nr:unnamed protein product [Polarella glacialis]